MRHTLTYIILLFSPILLTGQDFNVDSLKVQLIRADDIKKAEIFIELSEAYLPFKPDTSEYYAERALEVSDNVGNKELIAISYYQLAKASGNKADYTKALEYLNKAKTLAVDIQDRAILLKCLSTISEVYRKKQDLDLSIENAGSALDLARELEDSKEESQILKTLGDAYYAQNKYEKALETYLLSLETGKENDDFELLSSVYNRIGRYYYSQGDFKNATEYYAQNLEMSRRSNDERGAGIALNSMGNCNLQMGNLDEAIENYKQASEIFKTIGFHPGTAATLTGMAVIYENMRQFESALEVYKEVIDIRQRTGNKREIANTYSNIAVTYSLLLTDSLESLYGTSYQDTIFHKNLKINLHDGQEAIRYNQMALELRREINDKQGISVSLINLGNVYQSLGLFDKAGDYFRTWLEMPDVHRDDDAKAAIALGMGKLYLFEGDFANAILYLYQAYEIANKINKRSHIREATANLAELYEKRGDYRKALDYYKEYFQVNKELLEQESREQIYEMQVKYETEAKEKENEILRKDQQIAETKLRQSKRAIIFLILGFLIFVALLIQLIRQNRLRKKANEELAKKNALITEQTKEITDSILYASKIQNAMLPPDEVVNKLLNEQFTVYRPRDIVSGDFYWLTEKNNEIIIMVADCTGHGVPGAFMSMLGVAFLNEIVSKHEKVSADFILNELREQVIHSLHQTGREGESQDGMDVALFIINQSDKRLEYAGANNSLLIFRNNEMIELKADKMPIGIHTLHDKPFRRQEIPLKKGDMIYAFSDGYPDQFGGPAGKKFMIRNFKKLLHSIHEKSLKEQKSVLEKTLDDWMANTSQIDDIIVMGVRV